MTDHERLEEIERITLERLNGPCGDGADYQCLETVLELARGRWKGTTDGQPMVWPKFTDVRAI